MRAAGETLKSDILILRVRIPMQGRQRAWKNAARGGGNIASDRYSGVAIFPRAILIRKQERVEPICLTSEDW